MEYPKYVITTPIDPNREWTLDKFKEGIEKLNPQPEAVGIVTDKDVFDKHFSKDIYKFIDKHANKELYELDKIAINRDKLLNWFVYEREEPMQFWLDSDIEVNEDTYRKIYDDMSKEGSLIYRNGYTSSLAIKNGTAKDSRLCYGTGCVLIDRRIANVGKFYKGTMIKKDENKKEKIRNISEDAIYFATINGCSLIIKNFLNINKVMSIGEASSVTHHVK